MEIQQIKNRYGIIGRDPKLEKAIEIALKVAPTELSVLVRGENGVGKDVFATLIHENSKRASKPFFAVNCAAIAESIIDSELFGHEKGAFTGADETHKGYFEVMDGGTLFLDEVAELPKATQAKLLRVLQTKDFIRVGSTVVRKTDVRVIAATNRNLEEAMKSGEFRPDLYARLCGACIQLPPLRERKEDINLIFRKFALDAVAMTPMVQPIRLTPEAQDLLKTFHWSFNVRQLKNVVENMSALESERLISAEVLKSYVDDTIITPPITIKANDGFTSERELTLLYNVILPMKKELEELKSIVASLMHGETPAPMVDSIAQARPEIISQPTIANGNHSPIAKDDAQETDFEDSKVKKSIADANLELIIDTLERHNGNRRKAADELGISERTLYRKIKQHGIE